MRGLSGSVEWQGLSNCRSTWVSRLRAFVAAGPSALPAPDTLFGPNSADTAHVLLPLVARRTLKRLIVASVHVQAPPEIVAEWNRLVSALLELPDVALEAILVRPEFTGFVAKAEAHPQEGRQLVPWLGQLVTAAMVAHGGDLPPTRIARTEPRNVALAAASRIGMFDRPGIGPALAAVRAGHLEFLGEAVTWRPLPTFAGHVGLSTGHDAWLALSFPGVEHVAELDAEGTAQFTRSLEDAASVLRSVWPQAHDELLTILRWVVPLARRDSWYVPGMHGLVALSVCSGRRQVRDLFHETSHHKLSRILEIASAVRNPEHLVYSPFANGKGPVTSLLQSCWSFSCEYELIRRLKASGYIKPAEIEREELKFRVFFEKGLPVLRREARLTEVGDAVLSRIEEAVR